MRVQSPHMERREDDESLYLNTPTFQMPPRYPACPDWDGNSLYGWVNKEGTLIKLQGPVYMHRPAYTDQGSAQRKRHAHVGSHGVAEGKRMETAEAANMMQGERTMAGSACVPTSTTIIWSCSMKPTAHSRRASASPRRVVACSVGALLSNAAAAALAKKSDRQQPMNYTSNSSNAFNVPNTITTLTGNCEDHPGHACCSPGDLAKIYLDGDSQMSRIVVTGKPAHIQELDENNNMVTGDALQIDYDNMNQIAVLTTSLSCINNVAASSMATS
jgi:lipopolysaccharide export system protein LptA